jgi:anti-anti-sigma factor
MIRAHEQPSVLTLAVEGKATMLESPTLEGAALEHVACGGRSLRVDLRDCTAMDSTFSGTLLSLKRALAKVGGDLTLVSPSTKVEDGLEAMGLEDFYTIDRCGRLVGSWRDLAPATGADTPSLRRIVLAAHDELAGMTGPAALGFGEVAARLHEDAPGMPGGG